MYLLIEACDSRRDVTITAAVLLTQETFKTFLRLCELSARLEQIAKHEKLGDQAGISLLIDNVFATNHGEHDFEKDIAHGEAYNTDPYESLWECPQRVKELHPEIELELPEYGARVFVTFSGGVYFRLYIDDYEYETDVINLELLTPGH